MTVLVDIDGAVLVVVSEAALGEVLLLLLLLIELPGVGDVKGPGRLPVVLLELLLIDLDGLEATVLLVPLLLDSFLGDPGLTGVVRAPGLNGGTVGVCAPVGSTPLSRSASDQESEDLYQHIYNIKSRILSFMNMLLLLTYEEVHDGRRALDGRCRASDLSTG